MSFTRYHVTTIDELRTAIEGVPDEMKVEKADGVSFPAITVRELCALRSFPIGHAKLVIVVPRERDPESVVKIELVD